MSLLCNGLAGMIKSVNISRYRHEDIAAKSYDWLTCSDSVQKCSLNVTPFGVELARLYIGLKIQYYQETKSIISISNQINP